MDNLILDKYRDSLNVLSTEELQILEKKITIDVFNNFNNMLINANNSVDSNSQINVLKENLEKERLKNNEMKNKFSNEMTEEQNNWNEERKKIIKNHKINIDEKETEINLLEKKWRSKLEITENDNQHENIEKPYFLHLDICIQKFKINFELIRVKQKPLSPSMIKNWHLLINQ